MKRERKTKIVCTIGPACEQPEMLTQMMDAGMDVARLNFSHGTYEEHQGRINNIRRIAKEKGLHIAILLDTKGPEIRTGQFKDGFANFKQGDIVKVCKEEVLGDHERFSLSVPEVFEDVKVGDYLLIDDGKVRLDIIEKHNNEEFTARVFNSAPIKSKKGVNVPGVDLSIPFLSEKDVNDIEFGLKNNIDFIAASFVRNKQDMQQIKDILIKHNKLDVQLIAKIENHQGMENLREILEVADGIMVARGDFGVNCGVETVPIFQKKIIKVCNEMGKPVITATHMLDSMVSNPRPTRAEASDVANAVLDGSDAIMLSAESAAGEYPVVTVQTMGRIAHEAELIIPFEERLETAIKTKQPTVNDAIGVSVAQSSLTLKEVVAIVAFTETGGTARRMAKFRPDVPIIAVTNLEKTANTLQLLWGVFPYVTDHHDDWKVIDKTASEAAKSFGFKKGDKIIITSGLGQKHGTTNTLRIIDIE